MGGRYGNVKTGPSVRSPSGILTNAATTGPPGTGAPSQISRPAETPAIPSGVPGSGRTAMSTGGFGQGVGQASPQLDLSAYQPQIQQIATSGYRMMPPPAASTAPPPGVPGSGRTAMSTGGFGQGVGEVSQPSGPPSGRTAMSTGGFGSGYGASDPYADIDLDALNYRANTNARMVLPSAVEQRAAIAAGGTAYNPAQTARIEQIRKNEAMVPTGTTDLHDRGYEEHFAPGGNYDQGVPPSDQAVLDWLGTSDAQNFLGITPAGGDVSAGGGGGGIDLGGGGGIDLGGGGGIEGAYVDMYSDLRDDAATAYGTSEDYFTTEGVEGAGYWSGVGDRAGGYWDDRDAAASGYYGGMRDDQLEYLTGRDAREQAQILAMADMQRGNVGDQYQWMIDALNAEQTRRGGVYDELEATRGARLDTDQAALLGQMGTLEGQRLTQEQAMAEALGGRYATAQGGLDERRLGAEAALREQGVGPEAYTTAVGAETAALLGSQGLSSQDLQGRLASIAASESTDRQLGATGMFQDARTALADQLFGGRADLAENIAGRRTGLGQQNLAALAGIGTSELGSQQGLTNEIAQGQFGAGQAYRTGMYGSGETSAAGRYDANEAALAGAFGVGQGERAGIYGAQQTQQAELSRIGQQEASGRISRAEAEVARQRVHTEAVAARGRTEAEAVAGRQREAAQFAQIDTQMGLTPGTAQAMSAGGLLGDLYGDMMGSTAGSYENMMPWTSASGESYFVDPEIAMREEIRQGQGVTTVPQATYPVQVPGPDGQMVTVQMPINNWSDITSMQEYEALR